jgi:tRNA (guanine-N7-)-methyltransferase
MLNKTNGTYKLSESQPLPHPNLINTLERHRNGSWKKPISWHAQSFFSDFQEQYKNKTIILDSGCGKGHSCQYLQQLFPNQLIVGIDKSAYRLRFSSKKTNCYRANLIDFWRLAQRHNLSISRHYVLYPNPWPKNRQMQRRWYAHPIFKILMSLSPYTEIRSNWLHYLQEWQWCLQYQNLKLKSTIEQYKPQVGISAFEKKYLATDTPIYRLICENN